MPYKRNYGAAFGRAAYRAAKKYITPRNVARVGRYIGYTGSTTTQKKSASPSALTIQHDYRQTYKKRNMPKYKRKAWKKFSRKVLAVANKDRGLVTVLYNKRITSATVANTEQAVIACHLYGHSGSIGSAETGQKDLQTIVNNNEELRGWVGTSSPNGIMVKQDRTTKNAVEKIMFESAIIDFTLYNPTSGTLEVDVYTIVYNKFNVNSESEMLPSFTSGDINDVLPMQYDEAVSSKFSNINIRSRGATPFELGHVISRHGIKIIRKEKFYISSGQSINKQYRDAKNRYFDPRGLAGADDSTLSTTTYRYKDYTKTFLIVAKNVNPAAENSPVIEAGVTRTYKYTYEGLKHNKNYVATF